MTTPEVESLKQEVEFLKKRVELLKAEKQQNVLNNDPFAYGYKFTMGRAWASFLLSLPGFVISVLFLIFMLSMISSIFKGL